MTDTLPAFSSFSVDDLKRAKEFYANILNQIVIEEDYGLKIQIGDNAFVMVYPKPNHTPATYTVLNFPVNNIEQKVDDLASKGVEFEHYTGELQTDEKGISRNGPGPLMAWFKDPAGNFLSLLQEK
jgi:catechol-2,3-dioxygenase